MNFEIFKLLRLLFYKTESNWLCICLQYFLTHTHTHIQIRTFPHRMRDKRGMAGLTDQFPISPSHPAVIRSSSTWREDWIPLGFISSNYPLLPPHAVPSLPILYFSSGSWHCPLLPQSASLLPSIFACCSPLVVTVRFIPTLNPLDRSIMACSFS